MGSVAAGRRLARRDELRRARGALPVLAVEAQQIPYLLEPGADGGLVTAAEHQHGLLLGRAVEPFQREHARGAVRRPALLGRDRCRCRALSQHCATTRA